MSACTYALLATASLTCAFVIAFLAPTVAVRDQFWGLVTVWTLTGMVCLAVILGLLALAAMIK